MPTFQKIPLSFRFRRVSICIGRIIIASCASSALHRRLRCRPFSKLASVVSCRFSSLSVLSPTALARARGIVRNPVFKVCVKLSLIGLRFDVRSYFNIGRPPVKFRRNRSPSGTRTVDRSGTVFGLPSDVCRCFKIRCRAARSPSRLRISPLHGRVPIPAFGIVRIRPRGWIRNAIPVNRAPLFSINTPSS